MMKNLLILISFLSLLSSSFANPAEIQLGGARIASQVDKIVQESLKGTSYDVATDVRAGVVTLTGQAQASDIPNLIDKIKRVSGVTSVRNKLSALSTTTIVKLSKEPLSDIEIEDQIKRALRKEQLSPEVTVKVSQGVALLSGDLTSFREVDRALSIAMMIDGVQDVDSIVTVKGRQYPRMH